MKTVSAADANRYFSKLLREVSAGETVVVTSRGAPVAVIQPAEQGKADRKAAWDRQMARLRGQPVMNLPRMSRDELYDD